MSLKSEAIRYWRMGQYDTADIAQKLNASEAEVYAAISRRDEPAPIRKEPTPVDMRPYRPRQRKSDGTHPVYYQNRFTAKAARL